jgi:CheY-like chemotaxis protein
MKPLALVIENDGSTRRLLDVLLTRSGMEVDLVPAGTDALVLLEHARYDLVLLDLFLPGASGIEVLERIAGERSRMLAKVIVLSSAPERHLQQVRDSWPQVRIIRKPFELGEIVEGARTVTAGREERSPSFAEEFSRRSVRAGARAGLIVKRSGAVLEALHAFGYRPGELASYFPLPLDAPLPLCAAVRKATPVWLASVTLATAEYPLLQPMFEKHESRALAVVPLLRDGRAVGAVGWGFREPRLFTEAEQQTLLATAAALAEGLFDEAQRSAGAAGA